MIGTSTGCRNDDRHFAPIFACIVHCTTHRNNRKTIMLQYSERKKRERRIIAIDNKKQDTKQFYKKILMQITGKTNFIAYHDDERFCDKIFERYSMNARGSINWSNFSAAANINLFFFFKYCSCFSPHKIVPYIFFYYK